MILLDLVVQKVDSTIHQINHHPVNNTMDFVKTYPLDNALLDYHWEERETTDSLQAVCTMGHHSGEGRLLYLCKFVVPGNKCLFSLDITMRFTIPVKVQS